MAWGSEFFQQHRKELAKKIGGGLLVAAANRHMQRRSDMAYQFSQNADFWYLSGVSEPDWFLVYDGARDHTWLVEPKLSDTEKLFDGAADSEKLRVSSGANEVVSVDDFEQLLRGLARKHSTVYTPQQPNNIAGEHVVHNPAQRELVKVLARIFNSVIDCRSELAGLRAIKSDDEINAIKHAVDITVGAFELVRERVDDMQYEYEVEAEFGYAFRKAGATHAYDPIVAGGGRACTLHYGANNQPIRKGTAVLIDAGAEINGYCADITRTYTRGKPTKRYSQLHDALGYAHKDIVSIIEPSMPIADYLKQVDEIMQKTLMSVGLLRSLDDDRYRSYFPHSISHGLGIDVHDSLGGKRTLEAGMVLTVEPGIYINAEKIGIRLEDDVLVTKAGHKNLSERLSTDY